MSNIKSSKERIPFQQAGQPLRGVGQTWEERKAFLAQGGGAAVTALAPSRRPLDSFAKAQAHKPPEAGQFSARALYQQARMRFAGPYRPEAVERLEKGMRSTAAAETPLYNDKELLRIVKVVCNNESCWTQKSVRKHALERAKKRS